MLRDVFYYGDKPNAHPRERHAQSLEHARSLATTEHFWIINEFCDYRDFDWDFDFEFLPDDEVWTGEHNNVWPSYYQKDSGTWLCSKTPSEYIIYRNDVEPVKRKSQKHSAWVVLDDVDESKVDFAWHPDPTDPPYIYRWGSKWCAPEIKPCLEYHVKGATNVKYMDTFVELLPEWDKWKIAEDVDKNSFDFSWRPDPREPPFIYVWRNKWVDGKVQSTIEYRATDATQYKFIENYKVKLVQKPELFEILKPVVDFDFSWKPDPTSPPYIYIWGNKWIEPEIEPTLIYRVKGATEIKYMEDRVNLKPILENWYIPKNIDKNSFDFTWYPDPREPPFIYQFGTQHQKTGGPRYIAAGGTEIKYTSVQKATALPDENNLKKFQVVKKFKLDDFDYSWHPDDTEPPYIYVFGNQHYSAVKMPTVRYVEDNASEIKYINSVVATIGLDMTNWEIPDGVNTEGFDFSWLPDPDAPAYIYQFGTIEDKNDGPRYIVPCNEGEVVFLEKPSIMDDKVFPKYVIKTTLEELVKEHKDEIFWALNPDLDYSEFDFDWRPNIEQAQYVHAFGSSDNQDTQTYFVNGKMWQKGFREINYVEAKINIKTKIDMFFVDRGNPEANYRLEKLKERYPEIQKTRYLNSWVDTINRCTNKSATNLCWILDSTLDYSEFDFNYYPNPWQMKMIHIFGTQWSHWGTTYMINKDTFAEDTKWVKIIEHLSNLNFVKDRRAKATTVLYDFVVIDHGNREIDQVLQTIHEKAPARGMSTVKYDNSYFDTFKVLIKTLPEKKEHYLWVCSSVCDYSNFDFSYICDPFAKDQLHVFPSDKQKYGDTFLVDVNRMKELISGMSMLDDYSKINFNQHQRVKRLSPPAFVNSEDTHVNIKEIDMDFPYAVVVTTDNKELHVDDLEPISLWSPETKNILVTSTGGTRIIVPKEAKNYVKRELYDYPYIKKTSKLAESYPLDIVYLSNGEKTADENYEHLVKVTKGLPNRIVRVDGVNGRVQAYHAAAEASQTPWAFTVFAKLKVNHSFDWSWQPDRLQIPKHYIFEAMNPVNGLVYGHQAMIAYNKKLVLSNIGKGLDFTLDDEHEVVKMLSGTAHYNTDEFSTWRTAFRESIKLKAATDAESRERLQVWLTKSKGDFSEYSILGAKDAVSYYETVNGDIDKLKLSYEWVWLKEVFDSKYKK